MNSLAKEIHEWITGNNYGTYEGKTQGGHLKYRLRNGDVTHMAATPSKPSAVENAKSTVRRSLGVKSESPNAAKYTHKPTSGYDGRRHREGSGWDYPAQAKKLQERVDRLDRLLLECDPRRSPQKARRLAADRIAAEEKLAQFGIVPPKITERGVQPDAA